VPRCWARRKCGLLLPCEYVWTLGGTFIDALI
jgi:hypothetical protein